MAPRKTSSTIGTPGPAAAAAASVGPRLQLILDPPDKILYITADARMRSVSATCSLVGVAGVETQPVSYDWVVSLVMRSAGIPSAVGRSTSHPPIHALTTSPNFPIPFKAVRGGTLTVTVSTSLQGKRLAATAIAEIRGTNPTEADLRAAGVPETLILVMKQETALRQFLKTGSKSGYPLFSSDGLGGVGLGQITHPRPTDDEVWDWKANVKRAETLYQQKKAEAKRYLDGYPSSPEFHRLVEAYNRDRIATSSAVAKAPPSPYDTGRSDMIQPRLPIKPLIITLPPYTDEMLENETIRRYNGEILRVREYEARRQTDPQGLLAVEVKADGTHGTAEWHQVTAQERIAAYDAQQWPADRRGDPDYVAHVRNQVTPR